MNILSRIIDSFKYLDKNGLKKVAAITERMFRFKTMPAAEQRWEGKLVQYIGTTDATYTQGYFYICKKDETAGTYIWEQTDVQPNNDYVLWDGTHAQYEAEQDGIPVGAFLNFTDDYDENVKVGIYSTKETKTGELWIDNKPIYRKIIDIKNIPVRTVVSHNIPNIDTIIKDSLVIRRQDDFFIDGSFFNTETDKGISVVSRTGFWWDFNYNSSASPKIAYAILEYTKTTD